MNKTNMKILAEARYWEMEKLQEEEDRLYNDLDDDDGWDFTENEYDEE